MSQRVLIVEDDTEVRNSLLRWLSMDGFQVSTLPGGAQVNDTMAAGGVDLVLLDIGLPDIDGLTLTRRIRETHGAGIIIVSGRGDLMDRVVGLEAGADDYITKPFQPREILARIRSVLRRTEAMRQVAREPAMACHRYVFDGWALDVEAYTLENPEGSFVSLTSGEFQLLREFVTNANRVRSRDQLIEATAGHNSPAFDRSIDVRIARLRRKLRDSSRDPRYIRTVRNGGYIFVGKPAIA